jgi:uncharacterized membrane protein
MSEQILWIGILVVLVGIVLMVIGTVLALRTKGRVEGGFVLWIGPIPIVGATSKTMLYLLLFLSFAMLLLLLALRGG